MISAGLAAGKWLLAGNWKWALPLAAALAAGAWGYVQRTNYIECKAGWAKSEADAKQAALDAAALDAERTREIETRANAEKIAIRQEAREREDAINRTTDSLACADSGPFNALFDGVRKRQSAGSRKP